jgi:hypothetical protein
MLKASRCIRGTKLISAFLLFITATKSEADNFAPPAGMVDVTTINPSMVAFRGERLANLPVKPSRRESLARASVIIKARAAGRLIIRSLVGNRADRPQSRGIVASRIARRAASARREQDNKPEGEEVRRNIFHRNSRSA